MLWSVAAAPAPHAVRAAVMGVQDSEAPSVDAVAPKPPAQRAANATIAEEFELMAFGADPVSLTSERSVLARFTPEMRIFVSGTPADHAMAEAQASEIAKITKLPITVVSGGEPNVFVAVTPDPVETFKGPLRRLLDLALSGNQSDVDAFIGTVVADQRCWILPVWGDPRRETIKSAVIGVDQRIGQVEAGRCIFRKISGALGLLGPDGYLPRSLYNPQSGATRPSFEDQLILKLLADPRLPAPLTREQAASVVPQELQRLRHH